VTTAEAFVHYKLNIAEIDEQHWQLIVKMDEVIKAAKESDFPVLEQGIRNLEFALLSHLEAEERLMVRIGYPYLDEHNEAHNTLRDKMRSLVNDVCSGKLFGFVRLVEHLVADLSYILLGHIDSYDSQIGRYVAKQQIAL
jgi:hemerythrin-like metal-binding protein